MNHREHFDDSDVATSTSKPIRRYHPPPTPSSQVSTNETDATSMVSRSPAYSEISSKSFEELEPVEEIEKSAIPAKKHKHYRGLNIDWQEVMRFDNKQAAFDFFKKRYSNYLEIRRTDDKVTYRCSEYRAGCPHQMQLHFIPYSLEVSLRQNIEDHYHDNLAHASMNNVKKKLQELVKESVALKHGVAQVRTHLQLHGIPAPPQRQLTAQVQYYRRKLSNEGQPVTTLSDLLKWIEKHSEIPSDDEPHKPFVAYYSVLRQENEPELKFLVLLTTRHLLRMLLHSVEI